VGAGLAHRAKELATMATVRRITEIEADSTLEAINVLAGMCRETVSQPLAFNILVSAKRRLEDEYRAYLTGYGVTPVDPLHRGMTNALAPVKR
jgi:hypothetical protein